MNFKWLLGLTHLTYCTVVLSISSINKVNCALNLVQTVSFTNLPFFVVVTTEENNWGGHRE